MISGLNSVNSKSFTNMKDIKLLGENIYESNIVKNEVVGQ